MIRNFQLFIDNQESEMPGYLFPKTLFTYYFLIFFGFSMSSCKIFYIKWKFMTFVLSQVILNQSTVLPPLARNKYSQ